MDWLGYLVTFLIVALLTYIPGKMLAPMVFTSPRTKRRVFKLASLTPGQTFVDIGCGRGHMIVMAANRFGAKAIGYEIAPLQFLWATASVILSGAFLKGAKILYGDVLKQDLSGADVVFFYLLSPGIAKLKPKLEAELKVGTKVISNSYPVEGWTPSQIDDPDDQNAPLYVYIMGKHRP